MGHAAQNLGNDVVTVLAPGVVIGEDHMVGQMLGDSPHEGPLASVPIAAATEDAGQPALEVGAQVEQGLLQGVRGVSVIHHHQGAAAAAETLQAAGHAMHPLQSP